MGRATDVTVIVNTATCYYKADVVSYIFIVTDFAVDLGEDSFLVDGHF